MENYEIVKVLNKAVSYMELHSENSQKTRTINNALFNLERYNESLKDKTAEELQTIKGVGSSIADAIIEICSSGTWQALEDLLEKTPEGIQELMSIRGVGTAKIRSVWNEKGVKNPLEFLELANSGNLQKLKGFGAKTVETLKSNLEFYLKNKSKLLVSQGTETGNTILEEIQNKKPGFEVFFSGELLRQCEVINQLSFITPEPYEEVEKICVAIGVSIDPQSSGPRVIRGKIDEIYQIEFIITEKDYLEYDQMMHGSSGYHFAQLRENGLKNRSAYKNTSIEKIYNSLHLLTIPAEAREFPHLDFWKKDSENGRLIENSDIKGMLHCHSTYSDGHNTLKEMAQACIERGYEYLGICDHSKSAFYYANGMFEYRVDQQHEEIDKLNEELAPFKIFKGIESDIVSDGNLDYDDTWLSKFDFVVASVHSGLSMDLEKAMARLLTAIKNPYTTILGHLTGRILLERKGFPVDHKAIIDACAENNVGIEINAHPSRLDLDWRWANYAVEKGVMISINPDAHSTEGLDMTQYGVTMARKAGLKPEDILNTFDLEKASQYFMGLKSKKGINK